ncbi:uncharacterized protein K02A2.6-like [Ochlerotatus camptorhynchus]|uniref:uncharacterized protein K02A2.6-like n=1 Tax=Ochlerotatus camptorhynchus TaxID=644619 RepID=UPI0031D20F99
MEYVATDKFGHADILSRLINHHAKPDEDFVIASVSLEIQQSTKTDPVLKKVHRYVQVGWPNSLASDANRELLRFHLRRESLTTVQGCILFGERLVIPSPLCKRCLEELHRGHPGIQRMKALSRSYVYWPSLDSEIADYVKACSPCALTAKSPAAATPVPWPKPTHPWQRVHVDYVGPIDGDYYLLAVDSFSKWPEVIRTRRITASATISTLRSIFARLGMLETLVSDNGTKFTSSEFAQFCKTNGIDHVTTAPFHPQSNGQAERFVDTFKRAIKKLEEGRSSTDEALDTFLLAYRSTPNRSAPEGLSPSEIMFGRRLRTCLELLRPSPERPPPESSPADQKKSSMRSFSPSDLVYIKIYSKNTWNWVPGTVIERVGRVMYNVLTDSRRLVRSHLNQLRSRTSVCSNQGPGSSQSSKHKQLPLQALFDTWNPATTTASDIIRTPTLSPPATSTDMSSSSSSSSTTSSSFESAAASTPTVQPKVQLPRRSSRLRRPPQRFNLYHRF